MTLIHIHRYRGLEAPDGHYLCFPREGELEYDIDVYAPVIRPISDADKPIHCKDCGEPCVTCIWSYDGGFDGYCANCAYVHQDYDWKEMAA